MNNGKEANDINPITSIAAIAILLPPLLVKSIKTQKIPKRKIIPVNKLSEAIVVRIDFFEKNILYLKFIYPEKYSKFSFSTLG